MRKPAREQGRYKNVEHIALAHARAYATTVMPINISNEKQRDAVVAMEGVRPKRDVRYVDEDMNSVYTRRLLKTDVMHDLPELSKKMPEMEEVSEALVDGDT